MLEYDEVVKMFQEGQKINYDEVLQKVITKWETTDERPKVLLHSCCAIRCSGLYWAADADGSAFAGTNPTLTESKPEKKRGGPSDPH